MFAATTAPARATPRRKSNVRLRTSSTQAVLCGQGLCVHGAATPQRRAMPASQGPVISWVPNWGTPGVFVITVKKKNSDSSLMLICFVVVFFTYVFYLQSTHVKLGLHSVYSSYTTIKPSKHRNIKKAIRQKISLKLDPFILMCQMLFWRHYIDILRVWIRPQQVLFRFGVPTLPYSSSVLPPFSLHAHFLSAEPVRRSLSLQLAFLQLLLSFCYDLGISKSCQWGEGLEIQFLWECSLSSPWWSGKRKNRGAYIHIYKVYLWNYSIT